MILQEVPSIIDDLDTYISIKTGPDAEKYEKLTFENPVRFSYL